MKKKSNPIQKLLTTPGMGKAEPSGVRGKLASLFRAILDDIHMNPMWWGSLMNDFLTDYNKNMPATRQKLTTIRGNLMKELGNDEMTWKVFCKAVRFLQPLKAEFTVKLHWKHNRVTEHTTSLDFGRREDLAALMEELKETPSDAAEHEEKEEE